MKNENPPTATISKIDPNFIFVENARFSKAVRSFNSCIKASQSFYSFESLPKAFGWNIFSDLESEKDEPS